ncbi:MAG: hypothetical protein CL676_06910 [Bdellovibrionaceae bacterium]|nr:hypothetical protein [Pseudobdellovibrionaceae bacterium]|tara:strand:+ start:2594 stop:2833 length:240 start_codon:yes stop_codon:yes gene_type:complete
MKKLFIAFGLLTGLLSTNVLADEATNNLVKYCQKHCKKAKTPEKIHKCVEKKARLNKSFKKSKCWEVNEIFEKKNKESE